MARPRTTAFDDQRQAILHAAAALFARQGYTATSMNQVAAACGVSKPTLYHYVRDKHELLFRVTEGHIQRLQVLVSEVSGQQLPPREHLAALIACFVQAYADAQNEHRVLTEDVKFLDEPERQAVLAGQRRVVDAFAASIAALRPDLQGPRLGKPLAMLLFGMINWTFTWLKPGGALTHATLAPVVTELFLGGLSSLSAPQRR